MSTKILAIDSLSPKGRAFDEKKKFEVIGALPNEEVLIRLGPKKKKIQICFLEEVVKASQKRILPRCGHFPLCGGCAFQQWDYSAQLRHKENEIKKEFHRLIEKDHPAFLPIIGCENPWQYRNKMEFSFSENSRGEKFLGLMMAGYRGRVFNLSECFLVSPWFSEIVKAVKTWWEKSDLHAYRHSADFGHLRTLTLREAIQGSGKMVILTVSGNPKFALKRAQIQKFVEKIRALGNEDTLSIFLQIQQIAPGKPTQFFEMPLFGPDHITEQLNIEIAGEKKTLLCKLSPTSFFQPNTKQAGVLVSQALKMINNWKGKKVYDLYCGGAIFGLSAAFIAEEVIGIERNPYAVFDARWNQEANKIENFSIFRGDVGENLEKGQSFFKPDVVIIDPPRSGLDSKTLAYLKQCKAKEILSISCNPQTQAKNIEELTSSGYQLIKIQPIDQFPHTPHVENIAILNLSQ